MSGLKEVALQEDGKQYREGEQYTFDCVKFSDATLQAFRRLEGRIKTVIDSALADPTQRKATKDLAHQAMWQTRDQLLHQWLPQIEEIPSEVDRLANYLMKTLPHEIGKGDPQHGESAVDVAIRLLASIDWKA